MHKYQAAFFRRSTKECRYLDFFLPKGEIPEDEAYSALFDLPRTAGDDWDLVVLVLCDPPIRAVKDIERTRAAAKRIVEKIEKGTYREGQRMPPTPVWAVQLGLEGSYAPLEHAIHILKQRGYLTGTGRAVYVESRNLRTRPRSKRTPKPRLA